MQHVKATPIDRLTIWELLPCGNKRVIGYATVNRSAEISYEPGANVHGLRIKPVRVTKTACNSKPTTDN